MCTYMHTCTTTTATHTLLLLYVYSTLLVDKLSLRIEWKMGVKIQVGEKEKKFFTHLQSMQPNQPQHAHCPAPPSRPCQGHSTTFSLYCNKKLKIQVHFNPKQHHVRVYVQYLFCYAAHPPPPGHIVVVVVVQSVYGRAQPRAPKRTDGWGMCVCMMDDMRHRMSNIGTRCTAATVAPPPTNQTNQPCHSRATSS